MFEQDYVMRLIKEMIRAILKLLFNINTQSPSAELLQESEQKETLHKLLAMIDEGRINEAENLIYEITEETDIGNLKTALLFYSYLNDKDDDFLEDNNFSRDEIKQGLTDVISKYGLSNMAEMFLR
ncbi:MAG: DUF6483 family protein [Clostridium sp.]|nr:DUF6483 family protein [Acetatifactor muris]MCM1527032.1 DUF6483 family protein [Bacteroides sp.]MCM1562009.1 DUF6483 family protein [Clostridium sp.]